MKEDNYVKRKVTGSDTEDWVLGNPNLNASKREMLFIQLLEGLSAGEAECMCLAKDRTLHRKYKGLNANTVREAFGWNDDFCDPILMAERDGRPGGDLGRTAADIAEQRRTG